MQTRLLVSIPALLLGVALATVPAVAANAVAGSKGSGETATSRDAPLTLPGKVSPRPAPAFDPATLSRGALGLDPAAAAESMGTVTLSRDGSVDEQPASAGMRAILDAEMQGSNPAMSSGRVVSPSDARTQITDTSIYPAMTVGWLWTQDQAGKWSTCTGTLIGPKTVLTAAHCVYDHDSGGWVKEITFIPGASDAETAPYGQFDWSNISVPKGYTENYDGKNYSSIAAWDLAEIELAEDAGNQLGWMGFRADAGTDFHATLIGYPGDKPDGTMWQATCDVPAANFGEQIFWHTCDTATGSSGSAMWELDPDGNYYVRGIDIAEDDNTNYALRITDTYYQFLVDNYK